MVKLIFDIADDKWPVVALTVHALVTPLVVLKIISPKLVFSKIEFRAVGVVKVKSVADGAVTVWMVVGVVVKLTTLPIFCKTPLVAFENVVTFVADWYRTVPALPPDTLVAVKPIPAVTSPNINNYNQKHLFLNKWH